MIWALQIQVSIFDTCCIKKYQKNIGLLKYQNIIYHITNFPFRCSDAESNTGKSIGTKKAKS
jgi:hypothetical protein